MEPLRAEARSNCINNPGEAEVRGTWWKVGMRVTALKEFQEFRQGFRDRGKLHHQTRRASKGTERDKGSEARQNLYKTMGAGKVKSQWSWVPKIATKGLVSQRFISSGSGKRKTEHLGLSATVKSTGSGC